MKAPLDAPHTSGLFHLSPLRALAVAALIGNAVLFAFNVVPSAPEGHNIPHLIISLIVAAIVALRFRWTPVVGALACVGQIVEGLIFLGTIRAAVDSTAELIFATLFFAFPVVALGACIAVLVQQYRHPHGRSLVDAASSPRA